VLLSLDGGSCRDLAEEMGFCRVDDLIAALAENGSERGRLTRSYGQFGRPQKENV